ncbi:MAG: NAD(P)/FAD-dependent oxidoreductase [Gammaproteobacteria bacterium]|nr:NAD(P)/FAD-dependent oxidoreductase [Gammaproteobacteria bacterium]
METVECIVVGAGVVGLAIARALARAGREVIVLEAEDAIGTQVSSRNSGVIHAGIYYPQDSVRARVCVRGKRMLYDFCAEHGVHHQRIGKLIVANDVSQLEALDALKVKAELNGVNDLRRLQPAEAEALEPSLSIAGALLSPSTGIIDVHELMLAYQGDAEAHGAMVVLNTPCLGGELRDGAIIVDTGGEEAMRLQCRVLVNAAGLGAQRVASGLRGFEPTLIPPLYPAKGNYFGLNGRSPFSHLIYPMPDGAWLGVHVTLDLGGRCRFGPDLHWVDDLDYDVDMDQMDAFYASIRRWWPELPDGALYPDYSGIRPKLYPRGETASDFMIQTDAIHGVPGLVNLFGIESPGITSSMAIAEDLRNHLTPHLASKV